MFADDTNAIVSADSIDSLNRILNNLLELFQRWFSINGLKLNTDKTNVLLFKTTARNKDELAVRAEGELIANVDSVVFLGIHLDSFLNWKQELVALNNSISSACYALRGLRDVIGLKELKIVYHALVESRLRYSIKLWGFSYSYNIDSAFVLQKRAIRTIVRIPQSVSCKEFFIRLEILTAPCLYILVLLSDLSKHHSEIITESDNIKRLASRRKDLPTRIKPHLGVVKHSPLYQAVNLFNKLPISLKLLFDRPLTFKNKLKKFLLEKCYYSINEFLSDRN